MGRTPQKRGNGWIAGVRLIVFCARVWRVACPPQCSFRPVGPDLLQSSSLANISPSVLSVREFLRESTRDLFGVVWTAVNCPTSWRVFFAWFDPLLGEFLYFLSLSMREYSCVKARFESRALLCVLFHCSVSHCGCASFLKFPNLIIASCWLKLFFDVISNHLWALHWSVWSFCD